MIKNLLYILLFSLILWIVVTLYAQPQQNTLENRVIPPMDKAYENTQGYSILNAIRSAMDMQTLSQNDQLQTAAQRHAAYLVKNKTESHYETENTAGYTAKLPSERALKTGYLSKVSSENLSTKNRDIKASIEGLFSAIYHRFGFLDPSIDEIGIGIEQDKANSYNSAFVYMMGNSNLNHLCQRSSYQSSGKYWRLCKDDSKKIWDRDYKEAISQIKRYNPKIIAYPYRDQKDIPTVFYQEEPDPLPDYEVSGFPVSIEFNDHFFKNVTLLSFVLYDEEDRPVETKLLDKQSDTNHKLTAMQFALMPLKRLAYNSRYKAEVVYSHKGVQKDLIWNFDTRTFDEPLFKIDDSVSRIDVRPNSSNILYFEPRDAHDLIKDLRFPSSIFLEFLDHNTVRLTVGDNAPDNFTIKSNNRELQVHIKQ